jgi:predicted DNA binding CopG/RHH family protein
MANAKQKTLPEFVDEQAEAAFWDEHDSTALLDASEEVDVAFVDARPTKKQISLRLDPTTINQLKQVAGTKGIGYQTLIRMWVMERLAQESP